MDWIKSNTLTAWYIHIFERYGLSAKRYKNYRCKIVGIESDAQTKDIVLWILIRGIKNQTIAYSPKELVTDDLMIGEFSPFDARAITFYALMQEKYKNRYKPTYVIVAQTFSGGKSIFIINEVEKHGEIRKTAHELFCDRGLLGKFNQADLINIVSTAIQEQTIEDLEKIK